MPKLFIHAINVHHGGGAVLLADMLRAAATLTPAVDVEAMVDARMAVPVGLQAQVCLTSVAPSILSRLNAECELSQQVGADDHVLCFGNLPPIFPLKGDVSVFLQNRYLVDTQAPLAALPLRTRVRLHVERCWLMHRRANARRYFVQTPSMQRLAQERLGVPVVCTPFVPDDVIRLAMSHDAGQAETVPRYDFIYVASGEAHKNHAELIDAWSLLAEEGEFPSLALTLSPQAWPALADRIAQVRTSKGVQIHNLGAVPHTEMPALYRSAGALIYPSGFESFGLPLIEARQAGLPVLASELDYVRDITDPEESFDPASALSIARAVRRFRQGRRPFVAPAGVQPFLETVMRRSPP